jgi:hypothetical protein
MNCYVMNPVLLQKLEEEIRAKADELEEDLEDAGQLSGEKPSVLISWLSSMAENCSCFLEHEPNVDMPEAIGIGAHREKT